MRKGETIIGMNRRNVLKAIAGAAPLAVLATTKAEAKAKQSAVAYVAKSKDDSKQCKGCNFYIDPNGCKSVEGEIAPEGYCILWNKKPAA